MFKLLLKRMFRKRASLEEQLASLAKCGIKLRRGVTIQTLLRDNSREELEGDPYMLLTVLGVGREGEPFDPYCDGLRHFDAECIEDHGDYAALAEVMRDLAGEALPITDIGDDVDVEAGEARLRFTLYGDRFEWEAEVQDDWVDPSIFSRFAELLDSQHRDVHFSYLSLAQDFLVGCCTAAELKALRKVTGLDWVWLS